jgi:hypothetical protein
VALFIRSFFLLFPIFGAIGMLVVEDGKANSNIRNLEPAIFTIKEV